MTDRSHLERLKVNQKKPTSVGIHFTNRRLAKLLETVIANCVSVGRSGVCSKVKCQSKVIVPSNRLRLIDNITVCSLI